ncbi:MAG TPA: hypothetical protein VGZ93_13610 [Candidatus Methylacidiphilales bacterium]|nr:hypothetical protein [Candidatus Methylacidiphilales bacterium]
MIRLRFRATNQSIDCIQELIVCRTLLRADEHRCFSIAIRKTERQHRLCHLPIRFTRLHDPVVKLLFPFRINELLIVGEFFEIDFLRVEDGLTKILYLRRVRCQNLPKNSRLHLSDILCRVVNQGQFVQRVRLVHLIIICNGSQAEKKQSADNRENGADRPEDEHHLLAYGR